jgi:hypothetical protein
MKSIRLLLTSISIIFFLDSFSNTFRVNNTLTTDPAQKIFKTLKEAHDASVVAPGDTLLIEGTSATHADLIMTKPLVLIGTGYFLTGNPQTQYSVAQSIVSKITIKPEASGTVLIGLTFSDDFTSNAPIIEANNVIIMRCFIPNTLYFTGDVNNVQIIQNFFLNGGIDNYYTSDKFTNIVLRNNFITYPLNISSNTSTPRLFSTVENNIFMSSVVLTTTTFRSNIITNNSGTVSISSSLIQNNLVSQSQLPASNGNQTYDATQLFVGATGNSGDGQYKLKPTSPYLTAGYNNTQPGIYGGTMPYVLSGIPPIPTIYELAADGFGSKQSGLQVTIKAKANQ